MKPGVCDLCLYFDVLQFFLLQFIAANDFSSLIGWGLSIKLNHCTTKIIASDENGMDGEADSVINENHHELWLGKLFLVLCEHELHKIDLRHNFIEFISWSEHLEVGGYIKWFRTRPIQFSSTWMHHFCNMKGILPLLGTQKVFKWTFHAFCFNLSATQLEQMHCNNVSYPTRQKWALK